MKKCPSLRNVLGLFLSVSLMNIGTAQEAQYEAHDFTIPGEFTSGIEGPAVDKDGIIYAVNYRDKGTIGRIGPNGQTELFVALPEGSTGNGIRIDKMGMLYIADYTGHNILQIDPGTKKVSIFAHEPQMNQPNDLAICDNGTLFASDPNWQEGTGNLWRIDKDGTVTLLEDEMGTSNGVEVSPDEQTLYVNESVQRRVWAYDLDAEKNISNKRLLLTFDDFGMDGMRCDIAGNLFITRHGKGTVAMVSPTGELLREIKLKGTKPSNIAFGGKDGLTCYITLQDRGCFETFRVEEPGREFKMLHP